jgi:ribosomal protein S18 acetylase RimI-like enzyme
MTDLLVRLYDLESFNLPHEINGYSIHRAVSKELETLTDWVNTHFTNRWRSEVTKSFTNKPISCIVARQNSKLIGFAIYESTAPCYFGPAGVLPDHRGRGLGKALLYRSLNELRNIGYAYAVIGWAGPVEFYKKTVDALVIPKSDPGIYLKD